MPREVLSVSSPVPAAVALAFGPAAWVLLGVLAAMLAATLWERWRTAELVAVLLLAATLPCLIAGRFAPDLAVASAAGGPWPSASPSARSPFGNAQRLADACRLLHASPQTVGWDSAAPAHHRKPERRSSPRRGSREASCWRRWSCPCWRLPSWPPCCRSAERRRPDPLPRRSSRPSGRRGRISCRWSLVIGALVGHALRERSSGYAFSAGLVLEMAVMLGYALHATLAKQPFDATFFATLIQLFAVTAAVWAIVWLIGRKRFDVWREAPELPSPSGRGAGGEGSPFPSPLP